MKRIGCCLVLAGVVLLCSAGLAQQPPDYPMWCHGSAGMARVSGRTLIIIFQGGTVPAGESLDPGVCSWLDRGLRSGEPTRIEDVRRYPEEARIAARHINEGAEWTFWVYNEGTYMKARASYHGRQKHKPVAMD